LEKFEKITKNLKYWKTIFETETDQIWLPESQIKQSLGSGPRFKLGLTLSSGILI